MSRFLPLAVFGLLVGSLSLLSSGWVSAQDCERAIQGNTQSSCKQLDYLDGLLAPTVIAEQFTDNNGQYACQGFIEFMSATPLQDHSQVLVAGSNTFAEEVTHGLYGFRGKDSSGFRTIKYYASGESPGPVDDGWPNSGPAYTVDENRVVAPIGPKTYLDSSISDRALIYRYLVVAAWFGKEREIGRHVIISNTFDWPQNVSDYQLLMNQCLAGITRQLEQEAAVEEARQLAQEDKVKAEIAADEAKKQAELAAIELASAEAALLAAEELNATLLQETILAIKREDAIRAAWQQVMLVRMAGLEERTTIWNEAVSRWAEEDLQFSTAMEARIQEVERLQALNAALEQSMADQRAILIAQLEELEKAEQEGLQRRDSSN